MTLAHAVKIDLGQIKRRLRLAEIGLCHIELRLVGPRVDGEKHLSDFEVGPVSEMDLGNPPGHLRLDRNHFAGDEFADGINIVGNVLCYRRGDSHRCRRSFEAMAALFLAGGEENHAA